MALTLKTPYRDGTTHIVMSPLEFMQRLAALVPRPRLHLINFHGVLAPNAKLLAETIPSVPVNTNTPSADHGDAPLPLAPARISWARLLKWMFEIDIEQCPRCSGTLKIIAAIEHPPVIAGESGWSAEWERAAQRLCAERAAVIGIDLPVYLAGLRASDDGCHYVISEIEDLSRRVQRDLGTVEYRSPILAGVGEGGSLAYATLAQAPAATVAGAVVVDPASA